MTTAYTSDLPLDVVFDSGVLKVDVTTPGTTEIIGVTRGGLRFIPGTEWREIEYDGRKAPVVGLDRKSFVRARITGTMLQAGPEDLRAFEGGASGAGLVVTPKAIGVALAVGDYKKVELVLDRMGGGTVTIAFPYALCTEYELGTQGGSASEGEIPVTFEARQRLDDGSSSEGEMPYTITVTDPA